MDNIMVSLVAENKEHEIKKIQMKDSSGKTQETVSLAVLDYMLSTFRTLEDFFAKATQANWIPSADVTVKIVSETGKEYALPFDSYDLIFRCSEAACFRGEQKYIIKGEDNRMVSEAEFHDFFNEFTANVTETAGYTLLRQGYFSSCPSFASLLEEYYQKSQVDEDKWWVKADIAKMEKGFSSPRTPHTIEDYLRNYSIFREALAFNAKCRELRNTKQVEDSPVFENVSIPPVERHEKEYFQNKRSLCYVIGNACAPLILKTDDPIALDDFITSTYQSAKDVRRAYQDQIKAYILANREYVTKIRNQIGNQSYTGQVTILTHTDDGGFLRLSDGSYFRFPVIYSRTFKDVRKLYVNIDKLRKEYQTLRMQRDAIDDRIDVAKARATYQEFEKEMTEVIQKLGHEKEETQEQLKSVMNQIKTIIGNMRELEEADYRESEQHDNHNRVFSKYTSRVIGFADPAAISKSYKKKLDDWARSMEQSPYCYDNVRFIMRHLRQKKNDLLERGDNAYIPLTDSVPDYLVSDIDQKYVLKEEEPQEEKEETILHPEELDALYAGDVPSNVEKDNIHVHMHL